MGRKTVIDIDPARFPTPCYICDLGLLKSNLELLAEVKQKTGCKILLAQKGFAMFSVYPLIRQYLDGVCASSPHEARLGREEFGREVHAYAPAYSRQLIGEYLPHIDHLVFNSLNMWSEYLPMIQEQRPGVSCGLRVNPEYSEVEVELYNPCIPGSRFGVLASDLENRDLDGISGFHFHALCEQGSDVLEKVVAAFEQRFKQWLPELQWINLGGGHHITRPGYDVELLCSIVNRLQDTYGVTVYLEPGEAIALNTGILAATVLDTIYNGMDIAILDTSATAHMPDVLEMPYRPVIVGAGNPGEKPHTYRLGGLTCLAGDVIGDYSFDKPLETGDKLLFLDMAHYTMVKNTTFNGVELPSIGTYDPETDRLDIVRRFGYEDYKTRLS